MSSFSFPGVRWPDWAGRVGGGRAEGAGQPGEGQSALSSHHSRFSYLQQET
jgi:hypothetical protein